jgi:hypothetical protein
MTRRINLGRLSPHHRRRRHHQRFALLEAEHSLRGTACYLGSLPRAARASVGVGASSVREITGLPASAKLFDTSKTHGGHLTPHASLRRLEQIN